MSYRERPTIRVADLLGRGRREHRGAVDAGSQAREARGERVTVPPTQVVVGMSVGPLHRRGEASMTNPGLDGRRVAIIVRDRPRDGQAPARAGRPREIDGRDSDRLTRAQSVLGDLP